MKTPVKILIIIVSILLIPIIINSYFKINFYLDKGTGKEAIIEYYRGINCNKYSINSIQEYRSGSWIAGYTNGYNYDITGCDGLNYDIFFNTGTRHLILNKPEGKSELITKIK